MPRNASIKHKYKINSIRILIFLILLTIPLYCIYQFRSYKMLQKVKYNPNQDNNISQVENQNLTDSLICNPEVNFISKKGEKITICGEQLTGNNNFYNIKKLRIIYNNQDIAKCSADHGTIDTNSQTITLNNQIKIIYNNEYTLTAEYAHLEYYTGNGIFKDQLHLKSNDIELTANEAKIYDFGTKIAFEGNVDMWFNK